MANGDESEVGYAAQKPVVFKIEGLIGRVRDGPDGPAHVFALPGNEHAVGDGLGDDTEEVVIRFGDAIKLRAGRC
jgi:hypothetical protein